MYFFIDHSSICNGVAKCKTNVQYACLKMQVLVYYINEASKCIHDKFCGELEHRFG
jgi:hypothetical protein